MKAIVTTQYGPPEVLQLRENHNAYARSEPSPDQALCCCFANYLIICTLFGVTVVVKEEFELRRGGPTCP
jgi:hypothetical protein